MVVHCGLWFNSSPTALLDWLPSVACAVYNLQIFAEPFELTGIFSESTRQWFSQKKEKPMTDSVKHLTQNDLANRWNKSVHTIERYRCDGIGPAYLKIGGKVMYRLIDIEAFESERLFQRPNVHKPAQQKSESGLMLREAMNYWNKEACG